MTRYAEKTTVSVARSKAEIEETVERYGAKGYLSGWNQTQAVISFEMQGRQVKIFLPLPDRDNPEYRFTPGKRRQRDDQDTYKAWEQACRQKWRAMALYIKAQLEAIESGIRSFDQAFASDLVLPSGETVGQWLQPQLDRISETGKMPALLPGGED